MRCNILRTLPMALALVTIALVVGRAQPLNALTGETTREGPRSPSASDQTIEPSLRADINALLEATGAAQMGSQVAALVSGQILSGLRKSQPGIPDRALQLAQEVLKEEFAKMFEGPEGLGDQLVAIYAKHFTHDEIKGLLAFYNSPLGKKTIQQMPAIVQEGAAAGQQWAEKQLPRMSATLQQRLRAEGFIK